MTPLAPLLEAYFHERLLKQRRASPHTIASYRDTFRLLLVFAKQRLGKEPSDLLLSDLDAELVAAFLHHLETDRHNSVRTRNCRLAAIHSFFKYAAFQEPAHSALIQRVLAIPQKRCDHKVVTFLTESEADALLEAPDRSTWIGRRDHTLMLVAIHTGLRVSELTSLRWEQVEMEATPHIRCLGKGRKERVTPLRPPLVLALRAWFKELGAEPQDPVFPSRRGGPLSRDAVERRVTKHAARAEQTSPSLKGKRVTPHVLRHTTAVRLMAAGSGLAVIALILGHESPETTRIYLHADLSIKERAIALTAPPGVGMQRYRPSDPLLAFLVSL